MQLTPCRFCSYRHNVRKMIHCVCIHLCPCFPQYKQDLSNNIPVQDIVTHKTVVSTSMPLGFPIVPVWCHMAWVHKSLFPSWRRLGTTTYLPPAKSYILASPKCLTADWISHEYVPTGRTLDLFFQHTRTFKELVNNIWVLPPVLGYKS